MRTGIRAAKRNSTFSALMVCFLSMNFLDVHNGIKWYGISMDRGSLLQVELPLFPVEIAHDVVVYNGETEVSCRAEINHLQVLDVQ